MHRRELFALVGTAAIAPLALQCPAHAAAEQQQTSMYGLIGKISAAPGQRDALASILLESTQAMPGCLSYVVAADPADADAIWVTEVWDSAASHKASLGLPDVHAAIAKAKPIIAGFSNRVETLPIGGHGLPARR